MILQWEMIHNDPSYVGFQYVFIMFFISFIMYFL